MQVVPLGGHDLEWAQSNIKPDSFRAVIEALTLTEHPEVSANIESVASYAEISEESLKHLLQSEESPAGTSRFQLTALGETYVSQLLPNEKENILAIIAERNAGVRGLEWAKSNISPSDFKVAIDGLALAEHIANIEDVASYAEIPEESLKHLLQSETRPDGTSRFQLTTLGETYVSQLFSAEERETLIKTIMSR